MWVVRNGESKINPRFWFRPSLVVPVMEVKTIGRTSCFVLEVLDYLILRAPWNTSLEYTFHGLLPGDSS